MGRIILGLVLTAVGILFVLKGEWFYENFGAIPSAEKYLGGGGSRLFYKLLGVLLALIGFLIMTNLHLGFTNWLGQNLFGAFVPK